MREGLTYTAGQRDQVGQPEGDPLPLQLHSVEDNAGHHHADEYSHNELLEHLVAEVGNDSVQAIIALPACMR